MFFVRLTKDNPCSNRVEYNFTTVHVFTNVSVCPDNCQTTSFSAVVLEFFKGYFPRRRRIRTSERIQTGVTPVLGFGGFKTLAIQRLTDNLNKSLDVLAVRVFTAHKSSIVCLSRSLAKRERSTWPKCMHIKTRHFRRARLIIPLCVMSTRMYILTTRPVSEPLITVLLCGRLGLKTDNKHMRTELRAKPFSFCFLLRE